MQSTGPASHVFMYLCITISYKFHPSFNVQHLFWWGWRCGIRHWGSRLCGVRVIIAPQLCPTDTHLAASKLSAAMTIHGSVALAKQEAGPMSLPPRPSMPMRPAMPPPPPSADPATKDGGRSARPRAMGVEEHTTATGKR